MNTNVTELVDKTLTSPNFSRGKIFKSLAETLEASGVTITKALKNDLYAAIDKKIKTLLPLGKNFSVVSCKVGYKLNGEGEIIPVGRISTEDTTTVLDLGSELVIAKDRYVNLAAKLVKKDSDQLRRQLRLCKNAIVTRCYNLKLTGSAEDKTMAENYDKWLTAMETGRTEASKLESVMNGG